MSAQDLENLINQYAANQWVLERIVTTETARFMALETRTSSSWCSNTNDLPAC